MVSSPSRVTRGSSRGMMSWFAARDHWLLRAFSVLLMTIAPAWILQQLIQHYGGDVYQSQRTVERLSFTKRFSSYRALAVRKEPVVLTETLADQWPARKKWTAQFLSNKIKYGSVYSQRSNPVFITYHDNRTLEPVVPQRWEQYNTKRNMSVADVLRSSDTDVYHYFSEGIQDVEKQYPNVVNDIRPFKDLILTQEDTQINVWIGRAGIVTHTHYDSMYNFFVQLRGRKRFTLFPPSSPMYLYPCLHPHYGHSQVDINTPNYTSYPDFSPGNTIVADLGPGDMLFLPPFWFHHVETLVESVSVNVWSAAEELHIMDKVYTLPIPFDEDWDVDTMVTACRVYFEMMAEAVGLSFNDVWKSISLERYQPLVTDRKISFRDRLQHRCQDILQTISTKKLQWTEKFSRGLKAVVPHFQAIPDRLEGAADYNAIRALCLANYMEHIVAAVIPLEDIAPFFSHCM